METHQISYYNYGFIYIFFTNKINFSFIISGLVPPGKEKVFHELACYLG